jgi:AraC-like DNA-binding protein
MADSVIKLPSMSASPVPASSLQENFLRAQSPASATHKLLDHLPGVSFFAKNRQFLIVAANQPFFERFGFRSEDEIIGKDDFTLFPPRLAEHFRADDEAIITTGKPMLNIVELFFNSQGIPDWFITNKLPVFDRKGKTIGVMGMTQSYAGKKEMLQPYLQIDRAVDYIRQHFRERITVEDLAKMVHLSSRQLHRKFVETFGSSPQAFIMKLRIQAACEALQHEGSQIGEVARELGFCDQSSFTQHFQKHVGLTPLKYQMRFRLRRK